MKVSYRRELDRNYMILEQENFQDFFEVQMLIGNRIPGLLECKVNLVDGNGAFCYEITSKQSLKLMLERQRLSAKEFLHFLESLLDAVRICREYLLDSRRLLLRPEQIYLDPDSWTFSFCYFPFYEEELHGEVLNLAEYFLECLERRDAKAVSLGYEFYRIAGQENLSLEQMLEKGREERTEEEESGEEAGGTERSVQREERPSAAETSVLERHRSGQLVLRSRNAAYPSLTVEGDSFLIGKKKGTVDGLIKARGVSRLHGRITREEGTYYLSDLNSTNGTYLNGGRLEVNEKARIGPGDRVGFADVEYQVEIL